MSAAAGQDEGGSISFGRSPRSSRSVLYFEEKVLWAEAFATAYQHFNSLPVFATLSPYRRYHTRLVRHRLYLLATALQSKTPLPQDSLATRLIPAGTMQHDALVLTSRVAKEPGGEAIIKSPYFLQVWSHLLCVTSWRIHINAIEEAVGELLGVLEDDDYL